MQETKDPDETVQNSLTDEMLAKIADKVREDSSGLGRPTPIASLAALVPELDSDQVVAGLATMAADERWKDVRSLALPSGAVYFYSDEHIAPAAAFEKANREELQVRIADKVREVSRSLAELTSTDSLRTLLPDLEATEIEDTLSAMAQDDRYGDIKLVTATTGAAYLYSDTHVTESYAKILARAAANDACATIAATVRDESRIYPRPTQIRLFREAVFNINPDELEIHVARTVGRPEYNDIKMIVASTEAVYLYSDLYLDPDQALALVEWNEVGQHKNP
jgi:hypothetical protein